MSENYFRSIQTRHLWLAQLGRPNYNWKNSHAPRIDKCALIETRTTGFSQRHQFQPSPRTRKSIGNSRLVLKRNENRAIITLKASSRLFELNGELFTFDLFFSDLLHSHHRMAPLTDFQSNLFMFSSSFLFRQLFLSIHAFESRFSLRFHLPGVCPIPEY